MKGQCDRAPGFQYTMEAPSAQVAIVAVIRAEQLPSHILNWDANSSMVDGWRTMRRPFPRAQALSRFFSLVSMLRAGGDLTTPTRPNARKMRKAFKCMRPVGKSSPTRAPHGHVIGRLF